MKCIYTAGFNITEGQFYSILDQDSATGKVKISDDDGYVIWVSEHCFE